MRDLKRKAEEVLVEKELGKRDNDNEETRVKAVEEFTERIPKLEAAYDPEREEMLELKSMLYAKRQVLVHEAKQSRFPTPKGKLSLEAKNEMLAYARSVALIRLEAE